MTRPTTMMARRHVMAPAAPLRPAILAAAIALLLTGCSRLTGLPAADAQVRIWEGDAAIRGGNMLTPVKGDASGDGCIISEIGVPKSQVWYVGEKCRVCYRCDESPDDGSPPVEERL